MLRPDGDMWHEIVEEEEQARGWERAGVKRPGGVRQRTDDVACGVPGSTDTSLSLFLDTLSAAARV